MATELLIQSQLQQASASRVNWNLYTIQINEKAPSLELAARKLGLSVNDFNREFGLLPTDEKQKCFAIEIKSDVTPTTDPHLNGWKGPWSSPLIGPISDQSQID